jgi:hypothetical protein
MALTTNLSEGCTLIEPARLLFRILFIFKIGILYTTYDSKSAQGYTRENEHSDNTLWYQKAPKSKLRMTSLT